VEEEAGGQLGLSAHDRENLEHNEYRRTKAVKHGGGAIEVPLDGDIPDGGRNVEDSVIQKIDGERCLPRLAEVMNELPQETQLAIALRRGGYKGKEIAKKLGLTHAAVRTRLSRANEFFRERLGEPPAGVKWLDIAGVKP